LIVPLAPLRKALGNDSSASAKAYRDMELI
jgi:hypothetical protein